MASVPDRPRLLAVLAVLATALLLLAGNGLDPRWPLIWLAPIPILLLAAHTPSWRVAAASAALSMFLGSLTMLHYLHVVLHAPVAAWFIPFSLASLLFAGCVLLFRVLLRGGAVVSAVLALPAAWTVCDYLASFAPANGTADSLAYTQLRCLPILQVASLTGPWGITFLLLLFPSAVVTALYLRQTSPRKATAVLGVTVALLAAIVVFGVLRLAAPTAPPTIRIGLLATDTVAFADAPNRMQTLVQRYAVHAEQLARRGARIVVMPEKTGLLSDRNAPLVDPVLQAVADRTGAILVLGVVHALPQGSVNEARIYSPGHPIATYAKQHLLPPFESRMTPGASLTLLSGQAAPIGIAICKDMDFIHPALDYGRRGVGLVLDPAWDFNVDRAWHGHIAILRGVEGGYAIAHAAKEGFLTVTDDRGRILGEVRTDSAPFASLLVDTPLHHNPTVFARFGSWFPCLSALLLLIFLRRAWHTSHSR